MFLPYHYTRMSLFSFLYIIFNVFFFYYCFLSLQCLINLVFEYKNKNSNYEREVRTIKLTFIGRVLYDIILVKLKLDNYFYAFCFTGVLDVHGPNLFKTVQRNTIIQNVHFFNRWFFFSVCFDVVSHLKLCL